MLDRLTDAISAVCPIFGVSRINGNGNIRIDFKPEATSQQRVNAQAVLESFDWSQAAHYAWSEDLKPLRKQLRQAAQLALDSNTAYLAIGSPTAAQVRDQTEKLTRQMNHVISRLIQIE